MKTMLTVLVLAMVGCNGVGVQVPGDGEYVVVSYDQDFENHTFPGTPYTEAEAVRQGIKSWNALGARLALREEVSRERDLYASHYQIRRDTFSWPGEATTGVTWPGCDTSTIYPVSMQEQEMYTLADLRTVVAHEIGHALGLNHVYDGIMSPESGWLAKYPSAQDHAEFCRVWATNPACQERQ